MSSGEVAYASVHLMCFVYETRHVIFFIQMLSGD